MFKKISINNNYSIDENGNVEEYNESLYDNLTHEEYDILKEELYDH